MQYFRYNLCDLAHNMHSQDALTLLFATIYIIAVACLMVTVLEIDNPVTIYWYLKLHLHL